MGQDEANGTFSLDDDELDLNWHGHPGDQPVFSEIEALLQDYSQAMGGTYVPMPLWKGFGDRKLTITHPLGGCRIAPGRDEGVVNEHGQRWHYRAWTEWMAARDWADLKATRSSPPTGIV